MLQQQHFNVQHITSNNNEFPKKSYINHPKKHVQIKEVLIEDIKNDNYKAYQSLPCIPIKM
jgi:hypothetical protein